MPWTTSSASSSTSTSSSWSGSASPGPVRSRSGGAVLTKTLFLVSGEDTVVVSWDLAGGGADARLDVRPLVAFRDHHSLTHENGALDGTLDVSEGRVTIRPYPSHPALGFAHDAVELDRSGYWYRGFECD